MAAKKRGLGKGLDALLGSATNKEEVSSAEPTTAAASETQNLRELPLDIIQRGKYQPRRDIAPEALQELADSIQAQGVMQPIVVRPIAEDRYEIIAGERRWRASQLAGLDSIPVVIKPVDDDAAIAMALIENIQREDLNPMEEAIALQRLQQEFELTHQQVADAVGKSRTAITNLLRLLNLTEEVRTLLEHGDMEMGHARALLSLETTQQSEVARQVVAKELSVRQTEDLVRKLQQPAKAKQSSALNADVRRLQDDLSEKLGANVAIQHGAKGKGKLVVKYNNLDELEGILAHIK